MSQLETLRRMVFLKCWIMSIYVARAMSMKSGSSDRISKRALRKLLRLPSLIRYSNL